VVTRVVRRVRVDFARRVGDAVRLDGDATRTDLVVHRIQLREGDALDAWEPDEEDDGEPRDLIASGVVRFDREQGWVLDLAAEPVRDALPNESADERPA
jgi:hypothetical protein